MAKVQKNLTGRGGQTCGAVLKVVNKSGRLATLHRSIENLYPIGVTQSVTHNEPETVGNAQKLELEANAHEIEPPTCPQQDATMRACRVWTSRGR